MKLSNKSKYAIRALLALSSRQDKVFTPLKKLAEESKVPLKFLEQIFTQLKKSGLLRSNIGPTGGYQLARPAAEITLGQIIRVLDGTLAPVSCISQIAYHPCTCPDESRCRVRLIMSEVREAIVSIVDTTTLQILLEKEFPHV